MMLTSFQRNHCDRQFKTDKYLNYIQHSTQIIQGQTIESSTGSQLCSNETLHASQTLALQLNSVPLIFLHSLHVSLVGETYTVYNTSIYIYIIDIDNIYIYVHVYTYNKKKAVHMFKYICTWAYILKVFMIDRPSPNEIGSSCIGH